MSIFHICFFLSGLIASCADISPGINKKYLPHSYNLDNTLASFESTRRQSIRYIKVNQDRAINHKTVQRWKQRHFHGIYSRTHPVLEVTLSDIIKLERQLNRLFQIYYVQVRRNNQLPVNDLFELIQKTIHCRPLTNLEIRFLLNNETETAFPRKPLSMLMISSHDLLTRKGAAPLYPNIYSGYLREKYGLLKLKPLESTNLFATKNENIVYSTNINGFIYCRQ